AAVHPNGTTGIAAVVFGVTAVPTVRPSWADLFGQPAETDTYTLGDHTIRIADATTLEAEAATVLATRGSGPVEVVLRGPDRSLPLNLTHNARFTVSS
ncbi:hypothetical protein, partial [Salmonella enterica]|uniref:hypothetical protein n=1 Tax=Salmonella enterica TaxID=28901 RepID=UPI000D58052D